MNKKKILISDFSKIKEIFLTKKKYELEEVIIHRNLSKKILKITGYYRSTQLNSNQAQYFNDGIIEYYIDMKSNKIYSHFTTNRAFENNEIKQLGRNLNFSVVGVPNIYLLNVEDIKNTKIETNSALIEKYTIYNDSSKVKEMSFFGNKSILTDFTSKHIYKDSINIENLIYFKELRRYKLKSKKDQNYTDIEAIHEFFVTDISYTDTKEKENCRFYVFNKKKKYEYPFWEEINNVFYKKDTLTNQRFNSSFTEIND